MEITETYKKVLCVIIDQNRTIRFQRVRTENNRALIRPKGKNMWTPQFGPENVFLFVKPRLIPFVGPKLEPAILVVEGREEAEKITTGKLPIPLTLLDLRQVVEAVIAKSRMRNPPPNWFMIILIVLMIINVILGILGLAGVHIG